jgi:hypothetical protein
MSSTRRVPAVRPAALGSSTASTRVTMSSSDSGPAGGVGPGLRELPGSPSSSLHRDRAYHHISADPYLSRRKGVQLP